MKDSASVAGSFIYWVLFLPIECTCHRVQPVFCQGGTVQSLKRAK